MKRQAKKDKFLVDRKGKCLADNLSITYYKKLLEQVEMAESLAAYDAAIKSGEKPMPFSRAVAELRSKE